MQARMLRYWGTFARTGRPEGAVAWPALRERSRSVIRFTPTGDALLPWDGVSAEHRCGFWAQVGY